MQTRCFDNPATLCSPGCWKGLQETLCNTRGRVWPEFCYHHGSGSVSYLRTQFSMHKLLNKHILCMIQVQWETDLIYNGLGKVEAWYGSKIVIVLEFNYASEIFVLLESDFYLIHNLNLFVCFFLFQALNLILLTSSELSGLRDLLKNSLVNDAGRDLFVSLYASWCHSPMAIISLCFLAQVWTGS